MADLYISLLEDAEHELGLGEDMQQDLKKLGDSIRERLYKIAELLSKLEKNGWRWTTGAKDIYLHKPGIEDAQAAKELKNASIPENWFHFVH